MKRAEQLFYSSLRNQTRVRANWLLTQTENIACPGFPDVLLIRTFNDSEMICAGSALIELKAVGESVRGNSKFMKGSRSSSAQTNYHLQLHQAGYPSFYFVRGKKNKTLYLIPGSINAGMDGNAIEKMTADEAKGFETTWDGFFQEVEDAILQSMGKGGVL